ncbi:spore germination protein [Acetivibrio saccincola]|uniref:spore germination protein n=1 Tax=Acetivibrio saccincola TaxID=1677857 RepID=UPI0016B01BBE|nr:spore germination protein [Acetivibrio saccincola]NLW28172.1 spore germination protein [Acetivibrio saccincola]
MNDISLKITNLKDEVSKKRIKVEGAAIKELIVGFSWAKEGRSFDDLYSELLSGNCVFLAEGENKFYSVFTSRIERRGIEEPTTQSVVRGPREGFSEDIAKNILIIKKRINNNSLRMINLNVGRVCKTKVAIMYIEGIAKKDIVNEVKKRIEKIKVDAVHDSSYIEELTKDDPYSVFPTYLSLEKSDSVSAALLQGKVAILVDGTPFVLTVPAVFFDFLQSSEDYYHHYIVASMMRIIRFITFYFVLLVPSAYVAITTYHQEILPTALLINIAAQREDVPFPVLFETFLMEFTFEILREAGIRIPRAIGAAISVVGGVVIGQVAVEAGIMSAAVVIVVSFTAISSFSIPNYEMSSALRAVRFVFMILAGALGLYGLFMGIIILWLHLCKIKSVTVPYVTPLTPLIPRENKDTLIRFPLMENKKQDSWNWKA